MWVWVYDQDNTEAEVEAYLRRKYEGSIANAVVVDKEDLDLKNHLTGLKRPYLKVSASRVHQCGPIQRAHSHSPPIIPPP